MSMGASVPRWSTLLAASAPGGGLVASSLLERSRTSRLEISHDDELFVLEICMEGHHTGKSALQPHQVAQVASRTFLPRCSESVHKRSPRSGRLKSGASRDCNNVLRSACVAPSTQHFAGGVMHDGIVLLHLTQIERITARKSCGASITDGGFGLGLNGCCGLLDDD